MSKEAEKYVKSKGYFKTPFFPMEHVAKLMQSYADEQNKELREAVEGIKEAATYSKSWSKINKDEMRGAIYVSNLVLDKIKELEL